MHIISTCSLITVAAIFKEISMPSILLVTANKKLLYHISAIVAVSILIGIPTFFESTWEDVEDFGQTLKPTSLRLNPGYIIYYVFWIRIVALKLGFATFMMICSCKTLRNTLQGTFHRTSVIRCGIKIAQVYPKVAQKVITVLLL